MLQRLGSTLLLLFLCTGLRAADPATFGAMLDRYYEEYLALFPLDAATYGDSDRRYEAVWPNDIGAEHRGKVTAMCTRYLAELAGYDRAALAPANS